MARNRSIEIYLKPGVEEDDQIFAVWSALRGRGRPQDVFRRMLRVGLRAMVEAGELPRVALEGLDTELLMPVPPATALLIAGQGRQTARKTQAAQARAAADKVSAASASTGRASTAKTRPAPRRDAEAGAPAPVAEIHPVEPEMATATTAEIAAAEAPAPEPAPPGRPRLGRLM